MKERSLFYNEVHVAGRRYHEADLVWDELKVGKKGSSLNHGAFVKIERIER